MALAIVLLSGLIGVATSLIALVAFDASWSYALVLYLAASTVPAALIMAGFYVHMLLSRAFASPEIEAHATAPSRRG
jgi:hypothetical protein